MAVYTFDGPTLNIALPVDTELNVTDLYSRWKDYVKTSSANAGQPPAFDSTGGDTIDAGAGTSIPHYAFLKNGWEISPDEDDYTLAVTTGILLRLGGGDPFIDTAGAFTVRINYQQPVQAITVFGAEVDPGINTTEALRVILAALSGQLSGAPGPGVIDVLSPDGTKTRISTTVDANGNRTTDPTLDVS